MCHPHPVRVQDKNVEPIGSDRIIPILILSVCVACASPPVLDLPPRSQDARSGSEILPMIEDLTVQEREERLFDEFASGNVPDFMRRFVPVTLSRIDAEGQLREVRFDVLPDYLALGTDTDYFRMPMTRPSVKGSRDLLGCSLPTRQMVDDIWAAATAKLEPFPFSPEEYDIVAPSRFYAHHLQIERQRIGYPLGEIVAGIKKDVVVSQMLESVHDRVVIYGWHYRDGSAIQPLYGGHVDYYADYSHGIRLVREQVFVDGQPTTVAAVLGDLVLHPLLSDEGAFTSAAYPTGVEAGR